MAELKYEILEQFGVLSTSPSGWHLELNLVKWGDNQPKFDLRAWAPEHAKMGKGITLTQAELTNLQTVIGHVLDPNFVETPADEVAVAADDEDDFDDSPKVARLSDV
ncbi:MAG: hypothetical protein LBT80_01185 [Lactobacillaceae bacterium]|jgi:hypothetical protein|nr:hypothetical protein [Lactobacillaceae bacterium]